MRTHVVTRTSSFEGRGGARSSIGLPPMMLALALVALVGCQRADAGAGDSAATPSTTVAPTDTIFYGCSGGVTGGGSQVAITGRGEILVWRHQGPAAAPDYRQVGVDSVAAAELYRDLERARFRAIPPGEPSNMTCSVAIRDARGRHEVLFTPGSVPIALQSIVTRIEAIESSAPSDSLTAPRSADLTSPDPPSGSDSASVRPVTSAGDVRPSRAALASLVPVATGLTLISALHFPDGDRENRVVLTVSPEGVTYVWRFDERSSDGQRHDQGQVSRFVSANDLSRAPRLNAVFLGRDQEETPGYTAMTISSATFSTVLARGETSYTVTNLEGGPAALGGLLPSRLAYRGKLALVSRSMDSIPVLLDGRRTMLPAVRLHGDYALQDQPLRAEYWVLSDSTHPLLLKTVMGADVFQIVRIDRPATPAQRVTMQEVELETNCRLELPGVYFAFNSAELEQASDPAIAGVATLLQRHPDWTLTIEGHTDSIGNPQANQKLSVARAEAVRTALIQRSSVAAARLAAAGFGASRPRESNTTIEGRARNRRVELARNCADKH
jgi:outer membrane protein OmpA-like peptidoglycan-associated protein